jgi:hypothetical protein
VPIRSRDAAPEAGLFLGGRAGRTSDFNGAFAGRQALFVEATNKLKKTEKNFRLS